jgi:hypothetical protein
MVPPWAPSGTITEEPRWFPRGPLPAQRDGWESLGLGTQTGQQSYPFLVALVLSSLDYVAFHGFDGGFDCGLEGEACLPQGVVELA